jgi:putative hemolysin
MITQIQGKLRLAAATGALGQAPGASSHIVDTLIEERAGRLLDHPRLWQGLRAVFNPLLQDQRAIALADEVAPMSGRQLFEHVSRVLALRTEVRGLHHLPRAGSFFLAANHPTGIADGVAVFDAMRPARPDLCFMANRDAIRIAAGLADMIIPVDWRKEFRSTAKTRETLQGLSNAVKAGRPVVVFPSGRLAYLRWNGLTERPWLATTVTLARKYRAPILPLRIEGRNSALYYALAQVSDELRDITVFNEFLNKKGCHYRMTFGAPLAPETLPEDPEAAIAGLQRQVEQGAL